MKSITIFVENQRLSYLQKKPESNIPNSNSPRSDFFKQTQEAFKGKNKDKEPGLISRFINRIKNQEN